MPTIRVEIPSRNQTIEFDQGTPESVIQDVIKRDFPRNGQDVAYEVNQMPGFSKTISDEDFSLYEKFVDQKKTDLLQTALGAAGGIVETVGKGIKGLFEIRNLSPEVAASTALESGLQGTRDLYGMVAQSEDPSSFFFKFKDLLDGTSSVAERKKQWLEARDFVEQTQKYEAGKETVSGLDPALVNNDVKNTLKLIADPTLFIPGVGEVLGAGKFGTRATGLAMKGTGAVATAVTKPLSEFIGGVGRMAGEAIGADAGKLRNVAAGAGVTGYAMGIPGVSEAAAVVGAIEGANKAGQVLERAGGQLMNAPTRIGALESLALNPNASSFDRAIAKVGRYGGDDIIDMGSRALAGGVEGAAIGTVLGGLAGGEEGAAAGFGSGGVLGAGGAGIARVVDKASGKAAVEARHNDFNRFYENLDKDTQSKFDTVVKNSGIDGAAQVMDISGIIRGKFNDADVRFSTADEFATKYGQDARGVQIVEGERPVVDINVDKFNSQATVGHELFHAFKAIDQLRPLVERAEQMIVGNYVIDGNGQSTRTSPGLLDDAAILKTFDEYVSKLKPDENSKWAKANTLVEKSKLIGEELGAEYMSRLIQGSDTDAMLRGFDGLTRTILDKALLSNTEGFLRRTAQSLGLGSKPIESLVFTKLEQASPALNAALRDMVRARRNMNKKIELAEDTGFAIRNRDLANPAAAKIAIDMNIAEKGADGVTRMKLDDVMSQEDKVSLDSLKSVIKSTPVADVNAPRMRELDGKIVGDGISNAQLAAIQSSPNILDKVKQSFALIKSAIENGEVLYIRNGKATKKITSRLTGKTLTRYNDGVRLTERDGVPYSLAENKAGELYLNLFDISKARRNAMDLASKDRLGPYQADFQAFYGDLVRYLNNLSDPVNRVPSKELLGDAEKAAYLTDFFGQKEGDGKASKFIRSLTLDRMVEMRPTGERVRMTELAYDLNKARFMPAENLGETKVFDAPDSGFRIIAKGNKHSLYAPTGERIGIYDTQAGAERKVAINLSSKALQQYTAQKDGVKILGEFEELKNDVRFMPDSNQIIKSFEDFLSGNDLKTKYENRPYKSNNLVVSTPSGDTHSRVLPSRAPMVGSTVPESIPNHLRFKSKAELDKFIDAGVSWMRQNEHNFGNSEITPWFYDKMYLAADALAGGDMNKADLYLRMFAYLSPRTAVPANYTKSYSSGIVPFLGYFPAGNRAGTFDQTRAISQIINEWKQGEHFGYRTKGVDNKVYNFYLNGAAGLVKNAISKKVDLPPGVKSHPVLSDPLTLSRLSTNDMWQMMAFSKIAEDLGVRGNVWPGMVIKGKTKGFSWSDPKNGRTVNLTSDDALEVKRILSTSGENAIKGDQGAWDWSKLTPEESSALMYNPEKKTIMVFDEGTDAGLSAKGQGALYDHVQALSGMLADKINQAGGYAGKPHLDAYNVQELLWAIIKQENPLPEMRNYESYLAPAQELFAFVDRGMQGEVPGSVVSANKSFNRWAEQLASAEIDTSASSEWKTQMEVDRQRLSQAGDASPDVSIANEIAKRLPKWVENVVNDNGWNITLDDVSVDVGAYMGDGNNVIANTAIYLRGSGADFGKLDEFMRGAGSQQGGNHIRPMRAEERLLLDRSKSGQVAKIPEELDTKLANVLTIKGAQKLSQSDVVDLVSKLSELTDSEGNKFLTGLSRVGDEILIHDRYYRGSWETGQFVPSKFSQTSERFIDAVELNQTALKNTLDQFGLTNVELSNKVVTAESNPNFQYEGSQAIDRSGASAKRQKGTATGRQVQPKTKGARNVQPEPFYGLRGLYLDASRSAAPSSGVSFSWQYDPLQRTKSVLESKLASKQEKMDVGESPSRLELKLSQENKSRVSQLAVDSAVISAPDNRSMLRVTLEPGIAEDIFDSIQALVSGKQVDVTKLALRGRPEFLPTRNPVIKQAMVQATGELTGEKAALVEQLGKYQSSGDVKKTDSIKRQLNSLLDRVDTMVERGMLSQTQAGKITRKIPGEPRRLATEGGKIRFMPEVKFSTPEKLPNGQAWSTDNKYRVIQKEGGKYRVYAPTGAMIGVADTLDKSKKLIEKRSR